MKKWPGITNLKAYEKYISDWHTFLQTCEGAMRELEQENIRILTMYVLRLFYQTPYQAEDDEAFIRNFTQEENRCERHLEFKGLQQKRMSGSGI